MIQEDEEDEEDEEKKQFLELTWNKRIRGNLKERPPGIF